MATTSLGRLTLDLAVRLSEFTQGMSRAERETAERTKNMQNAVTSFKQNLVEQLGGTQIGGVIDNLSSKLGGLKGGAGMAAAGLAGLAIGGAAVAIGGLSRLAIETAKADTQLAILANRANTSVQNFQTLSVAAQGLGISTDQLGSMLADVQEKLGEFSATAGGEAADFFDALKNNTKMTDEQIKQFGKTLQGKDGVEALQLIKNKLDELGASAQEQRFILESLGNDVGNLGVIFADGGAILNQYRDALEEAGVLKTQEAIEQSQLLAAQTQAVQIKYEGFKSQLAQQMMPTLSALANHFFSGGKKSSDFGAIIQGVGYVAKGVAVALVVTGGVVAQFARTVGEAFSQLQNIAQTGYDFMMADGVTAKMAVVANGFRRGVDSYMNYASSSIEAYKNAGASIANLFADNVGKNTDALTQAILATNQATNKHTEGLRVDTEAAKENEKANKAAAKARTDAAKAQSDAAKVANISRVAAEAVKDIGVSEKNNPNKIMGYQRAIGYMSNRIDAWCASFVGAALEKSGFKSTRSASARSYEKYGVAFDKNQTIPAGAIATVKRNGGSGRHVFIIEKDLGNGKVSTIEGNYGDKVTRNVRDKSQLITVRIPITKDGKVADTKVDAAALKDLSSVDDSADRQLAELERKKQSITQQYATQAEKDAMEHRQRLADIASTYAKGSLEYQKYTALEKARYEQLTQEREIERKLRYAEGEERITLEHQKTVLQIKRDFAEDDPSYQIMLDKATAAYEEDLKKFRWAAGEKVRAQQEMIKKLSDDMTASSRNSTQETIDILNRGSMRPEDYQLWRIGNDYANQKDEAESLKDQRMREIEAVDSSTGDFLLEAEQRNALIQQAEQEHVDRMALIHATYHANLRDAEKQIAEQRVQTATQSFAAQTEAMKTFFGEQSGLYRAAAIMERSYAVYQAIMNAEETRSNVYTSIAAIPHIGPKLAGPMSVAAVAIQVANAARIGNTPIPSFSGVAHGGMDYIPKETTFLLDKGERVLSPRQNRDLTNYLSQRQKGMDNGGNTINVNVNVDSNGGDVQADHALGKQMGEAMVATVYKVLYKEKRQGGILE